MTYNSHVDTSVVSLIKCDVVAKFLSLSKVRATVPSARCFYDEELRHCPVRIRWLLECSARTGRRFLKLALKGNGVHAQRTRGEADEDHSLVGMAWAGSSYVRRRQPADLKTTRLTERRR